MNRLAHVGKLCFVSNIFFIGECLPIPYSWQPATTYKVQTKLKIKKKIAHNVQFRSIKVRMGGCLKLSHFQMMPSCMINMPNSSILCLGFVICGRFKMIIFVKPQTLARRRSPLFC